jgi:uncharacterized membrane protein YbhN (UPF0104 family)
MMSASEPEIPAQQPARSARGWLLRVVPWIIALGILAYVIARVPRDSLMDALAQVSVWRLALLAMGFGAALLAADSLALWAAFKVSVPASRVPYWSVIQMRGASHLLAQVSYAAGQGSLVYFLRQRHRWPVATGAGALVLANGAFIIVMALAMGTGLLAGAVPDRPELRWVAMIVAAAVPLYLALLAWRPGPLMRRRLLAPLFRAGARGSLHVASARAVHLGVLITGHMMAMRLFAVDVPLVVALAGLPVMFLIGALPISPAGLGTTQAAAITLFGAFAPGGSEASRHAVLLAYSLSFQLAVTAVMMSVGLVCLRRVSGGHPSSPGAAPGSS